MIIDHIQNAARYFGCNENIRAALQFLAENTDPDALQDGAHEIIPNEVIAHVITASTHSRTSADMEIHKEFMDIHYMIDGAERCGVAPLPTEDIPYDAEKDIGFYPCEDTYDVRIGPNEFYAVWPMEPHRPLCNAEADEAPVRKIVVKVKID